MGNQFKVSDDNVIYTLYRLLQNLNAKVTRQTLREKILQHPDFPSLLSMSDVLSSWNIENAALQLHTVEQLREIPLPFITQLKKKGGWYILVNQIHEKYIQCTDSEQGDVTLSVSEFEEKWTGIVLLAETEEQSGEIDYNIKRRKERLSNLRGPFVLMGALVVLFIALIVRGGSYSSTNWLLVFTKISGLFLTSLLTAKQLGSKNDLTERICRINAKTSCEDVLNSPAAKLWGWLSWSDLGLLYFAGGLVTLALMDSQSSIRPLLNGIALIAMPYIVFSIYYQAHHVRQWCVLCIGVQVVFAVEGLIALNELTSLPNFIQPYLVLLISFLLPTLAWVTIKPLLTNRYQSRREHEELIALKRNPVIFRTLLIQQHKAPPIPINLHPITLGNVDAENKITVVMNLDCSSCSKVHKKLEQLVLHNQNVGVNIIFYSNGEFNQATKVAIHLLALAKQGTVAIDALTDWYNQKDKDYNTWVKQYPIGIKMSEVADTLQKHSYWCKVADVMVTPTIYINNYKIPEMYDIENLQWMLSRRIETDNVFEVNT